MKRSEIAKAYQKGLAKYIPENALDILVELLMQKPIQVQIKNNRKTKHGDFKPAHGSRSKAVITINGTLDPQPFLLVLIHEIAHQHVWENYGRKAAPHGLEWKQCFVQLFEPFYPCFSTVEQKVLRAYFKNPSATTLSHAKIFETFMRKADEGAFVKDLPLLQEFELSQQPGRKWRLDAKRRTRYLCTCLSTSKQYLIHGQAAIL